MLIRDKVSGKLIVTTKTMSTKMLPNMNRKTRRGFLNRPRYAMTARKVQDLFGFVWPLVGNMKKPKVGGKYLTGYYSSLLSVAKSL